MRAQLERFEEEDFLRVQKLVERAQENVQRLNKEQIQRLRENVDRLGERRTREVDTDVRNAQMRVLELSRQLQDRSQRQSIRDRSIRDREGGNGVYADGEPGVIPARIVGRREEPQCTDQARLDEVESTISIQGVVRGDGDFEVQRIMVDGDTSDEILGETVASIRNWDFEPGTRDGEPVDVFHTIEMDFDCN